MSTADELPRGVRVERFQRPEAGSETYRDTSGSGTLAMTCHSPRIGVGFLAIVAHLAASGWANSLELRLDDLPRGLVTLVCGAGAVVVATRAWAAHVRVELDRGVVTVTRTLLHWNRAERFPTSGWRWVRSFDGSVVADRGGATQVIAEGLPARQAEHVAQLLRAALGLERAPTPRMRVEPTEERELEDEPSRARTTRAKR